MPSRPTLVRVALMVVLLAGLVALADGIVQHELRQATSATAPLPVAEVRRTTGAVR